MFYAFNVNGIANITNDTNLIPNGISWIEIQTNNIPPVDGGYYTVDYENKVLKSVLFEDKNSMPKETDPIQTQIQALTKQQEFLEDCIAEMAGEVYS